MAYDTFTLTIRERTLDGQNPTSVKVAVYPLADNDGTLLKEIKDTAGQVVLSGHARVSIPKGGDTAEVTLTLPDPRDVTLNPTGFGFRVHVSTNYFSRPAVVFGSAELDAHESGGVLYLEDVTEVDPAMFTALTTYVEKPTGGTDGQALLKSGADVVWGTVTGGPGGGSGDMVSTNNLSDLASASAARTNLGLGTAAVHNHGDYDASGAAASAQAAAISAAATDATTKANTAQAAAQSYADTRTPAATTSVSGLVELATNTEATTGTDTQRAVTPAGLKAAIDALIAGAPGALDTLAEIATQLATDETAVSALTTTVGGKLAKASNLSDLTDAAAARTNLSLGQVTNTSDANKPVSTAQATADAAIGTAAATDATTKANAAQAAAIQRANHTGVDTFTMATATSPVPLTITQPNTVDPLTSTELMQAFYKSVKGMWMNEGGNLRSESYDFDQVPLKLFGRRATGTQTANLLEIYTGGASSTIIYSISPAGRPKIGANQTTGVNTIVLSAAASVPSGLPANTVILRTTT